MLNINSKNFNVTYSSQSIPFSSIFEFCLRENYYIKIQKSRVLAAEEYFTFAQRSLIVEHFNYKKFYTLHLHLNYIFSTFLGAFVYI